MECPQCYAQNPENAVYCQKCGTEIHRVVAAQPTPPPLATSAYICPQCGKDDMVRKVSAVYASGFSSVTYQEPVMVQTDNGPVYGYVDKNDTRVTPLSQRLAPPQKPNKNSQINGCGIILIMCGVAGVLLFLALISSWSEGVTTGVTFGAILLVAGLYFWDVIHKVQVYNRVMPYWERWMAKWNELYYCARNDCVFDPKTGESVPSIRMKDLLFK